MFSADAEIARAYEPGNDGHRLLRLHYGDRFVPSLHDAVNKHLLGSAMRENDCLRREIENLLHPLIWHSLKKFWASDEAALHGIAVAEIPLYLESGQRDADLSLAEECRPVLVGVHCPFQLREQRLLSKRGWTQDLIASMESWQWPEEAKIAACDMVVNNTGTLDELEAESMRLADALAGLRLQRARTGLSRVSRFWDSGPEVLCPSV